MLIARLETDTKYYEISILKDLLNNLVLVCHYGSKLTKFSQRKNILIDSVEAVLKLAEKNIKLRKQHKYKAMYLTPKLALSKMSISQDG